MEIPKSNTKVLNFRDAKRLAKEIHKDHHVTLYCGCTFKEGSVDLSSCGYKPQSDEKRAKRMEWEHVVPAHSFGQSFKEWREGAPQCVKKGKPFKGRKCAQTNAEFSKMEADLYNLWPEIGELNGLRSNYSFAELQKSDFDFGGCKVKLADRKFMPTDAAKGIVARTYMYMNQVYPGRGIISGTNQKLYEAWSKTYPPSEWECERARRIEKVQGNTNQVLSEVCKLKSTESKKLD